MHTESLRLARGLRDLGIDLPSVGSLGAVAHDATCREVRGALLASIEETLREVDDRLRDLRQTKRSLQTLQDGLAGLAPRQVRLRGVEPCGCVVLVDKLATGGARRTRRS